MFAPSCSSNRKLSISHPVIRLFPHYIYANSAVNLTKGEQLLLLAVAGGKMLPPEGRFTTRRTAFTNRKRKQQGGWFEALAASMHLPSCPSTYRGCNTPGSNGDESLFVL